MLIGGDMLSVWIKEGGTTILAKRRKTVLHSIQNDEKIP
jgi:hypothetical protein